MLDYKHYGHRRHDHIIDGFLTGEGMSLRDWFAGMALQGMLSNLSLPEAFLGADIRTIVEEICAKSFEYADAMLKQRRQE